MKVQLFPVDQHQLMIKLFIKYSYIFYKQDKKLQIIYNKFGLFCSYLSSNYKIYDDHFYIIKFEFNNKITYIWNHFTCNEEDLRICDQKKINKFFKKCQKVHPKYIDG